MAKTQWTIQQRSAIYKSDSDVLLTASAGSGKTAVLAERFLNLIVGKEHKCSIDSILVMTFTKDAVAEMRKRIGDRLAKYVEEHPSDIHARRQMAMLGSAQICTLDSFSSSLLREFFYLADVDPSFDIISPDEKELVLSRFLDEILEENYAGLGGIDQSAFYSFVNAYGGKRGDSRVPGLIRSLAFFLEAVVDCDTWLENCIPSVDELDRRVGVYKQALAERFTRNIDIALDDLRVAFRLVNEVFEAVDFYNDFLNDAVACLTDLKKQVEKTIDNSIAEKLSNKKNLKINATLPSKRTGEAGDKEMVKGYIARARKRIDNIISVFNGDDNLSRQIIAVKPHMQVIVDLYREMMVRYREFKAGNVLLDYSDLNHKVLEVLMKDGQTTPAAQEQKQRYNFILVDEYQDISPLQETLLSAIKSESSTGSNMFMVGDVKQSIYRFRQAAPEIILGKHDRFTPVFDGGIEVNSQTPAGGRIELNKNFRSRREVVDFVNYVFDRTMVRDFGGIDYCNDGRMEYGARYYDDLDCSYKGKYKPVELHLVDTESSGTSASDISPDSVGMMDSVRKEAVIVAGRIKEMVGNSEDGAEFDVLVPEAKEVRPVQYRDITVLLRSLKSQANIYAEVFADFGLPFYVQQDSGLFDSVEVKYIISILRLIDNPCQDIPLAAVLRGPYGQLTESQLAEIRAESSGGYYYHALQEYLDRSADTELAQKLKKIFDDIDHWRSLARGGTLGALVRTIYKQTLLPIYYRGLPDGRQRYANLLYLYHKACEFDSFSSQGLGRFIRQVDTLNKSSEDNGPARILGANDNVVQIMSVHKSKGLEFPVVFVASLAKGFNLRNASGDMLLTSLENGAYAMDVKAADGQQSWKTLPREILSEKEKLDSKYEELRIQYVALTRAREHLVLVGGVKLDKFLKESKKQKDQQAHKRLLDPANADTCCSEAQLEDAGSALELYTMALVDHPSFMDSLNGIINETFTVPGADFAMKVYREPDLEKVVSDHRVVIEPVDVEMLLEAGQGDCPEAVREVVDRIEWRYKYKDAVRCSARAGVTELNAALKADSVENEISVSRLFAYDDDSRLTGDFSRKPAFMDKAAIKATAAEKGVWVHRFLELVDLDGDVSSDGLKSQLEHMVSRGCFTPEQAGNIDIKSLADFFQSDTGSRLAANSSNVYREWEFTLAVDAVELYPELASGPDGLSGNNVVVRGIIDCLFWNGSSYEIIDFKTDAVVGDELQKRAAGYKFQLDFYSRAVKEITGKDVTLRRLFFLKESVSVDL